MFFILHSAESLVRPRARPDRSLSPDSAAEYWAEARRLACYPNARLPDSTSLPAIERYDFPAPPSPAVVMIDKRREKRLTAQRKKATDTLDSTIPDGDVGGVAVESNELTDAELSDLPANVTAKLHQIDSEIETLKRLGESSGITAALIQELQASKLVHARGPDLDPVSASRSPSANTEPGYKTRYERHVFASPSRDTRRDRRTAHGLSYRMDYSSTGGRSGTIPSCTSIPRPGYTSGALYSRAISLPRPVAVGAGGDIGQVNHLTSTPRMPLSSTGLRIAGPGQPRSGAGLRSGERLLYSGAMVDSVSGDRTLNTDESLLTTLAGAESQQLTHDGITSLATSALSVDGLTVCSGDDTATLGPSSGTYCIKSGTMTGLPPSVTGLRPVSSMLKQRGLATRHRSRTQTPVRHASGYGISDSEILDVDSYPSVQSWLRRPSQKKMSFKTYPYEQLRSSATQPIKGLDRTRLENYLSPDEFEALFRMPLVTFQRLPEWKRFDLKKRLELL
ncbi:Dematin [Fasciolopsis buskii]|uniref:Dematin n=1 Tax=Fasciolopsis buskii TaxID=27845 RepID=A0A8E0S6N2_9TREM|nr:Dematin [Fasciolopsis buski]